MSTHKKSNPKVAFNIISYYFNQATLLPSLTRLACSASDPGYRHAHIATSAIKPPLHSTALGLPVVNQSTATLELIVINIKYLNLVGKTRFSDQPRRNGPNSL
jgi:hypothetical protein